MDSLSAKKYLIIGPAWVGDMVMAQTLFRFLKAREPDCAIDVVAPKSTHALLARMPEVSDAIVLPVGRGELKFGARYAVAKACREKAYDQALVLANTFKSALIPKFARIPLRAGWRRELRQLLLNDCRVLDKKRYPLMIERFVALALTEKELMPDLEPYYPCFQISENDICHALHKVGLSKPEKPILALCPGAEFGPSKRWPEKHYAAVANDRLEKGWDVWLFGGPNDQAVAKALNTLTQDRCIDLTGKTTLPEAIDLLSLAAAVVSNDSGLMHIAAALQKPLVVLYGSSSPGFTPPLSTTAVALRTGIECSPCFERECPLGHWKCMRELMPEKAIAALGSL